VDWVVAKPFTADRITELLKEMSSHGEAKRQSTLTTVAAA
jgi:hypothetical protein